MNSKFKQILSLLLAVSARLTVMAQEQPVMTVSLAEIAVLNPAGGEVAFIGVTNPGSGYQTEPTITFTGGGGTGASAEAEIDLSGTIVAIKILSSGTGYTSAPGIAFSAPTGLDGNGVVAQATVFIGNAPFVAPFQNESYGAAQLTIALKGLAVGTFPASGFTYEFFANNISLGVKDGVPPGVPATIGWSPPQPGSYFLTVKATDGARTATSLPVRYFATGVVFTSPTPNTLVPNGSSVALQATATPQPLSIGGNNAFVRRIDFYSDGVLIGTDDTYPYSLIYTPGAPPTPNTPNIKHVVEARAFDNNNNAVPVSFPGAATLDLFMVPPIGTPPTSIITSPANNSVIPIPPGGTSIPVEVSAGSPTADGRITKVELYVDGVLLGTDTEFPYSFTWTPTVVGSYRLLALAYDDKSNVVASTVAPATTTITIAASPTVSIIAPAAGADLALGETTTLTATANDSNVGGAITRVQFFVNGTFAGEATNPIGNQFSANFTPASAGSKTITAVATNQLGLTTNAAGRTVNVLAAPAGDGGSSTAIKDIVVEGVIFGGDQPGSFTAVNTAGRSVTFIGAVTVGGTVRSYFFSGIPASGTGGFSGSNAAGQTISGTFSDTGAFGTLGNGISFSGTLVMQGAGSEVASGYYTGSIAGRPNSAVTAIIAPNRAMSLIISDGATRTSAKGLVNSTGSFNVPTSSGTFVGRVDPVTGFVSGTINGGIGGEFTAAGISDTAPSNGFLRNLSTRGQVGTGNNVLVAGFIVGGTAPKQMLIRAAGGSSLGNFGIQNTLPNPSLEVRNSVGALVASNDNWNGDAAIANAISSTGAFAIAPSSTDAAVLTSLAPGSYTAQVSGVGGTTGIALVELYDTDTLTAFSPRRVINISTRGVVGPGQGQLTAGFIVNGSLPKKVLIRAAGPGLGAVAPALASGVLADPTLRLVRILNSGNVVVRENDNWEMGNDAPVLTEAAKGVGAFPFAAGSKDAAILLNLPPGVYTAEVSGSTTGLALVEVYEVE